ncbi:VRR-NUC domain-containing protein [Dichomitus squalens]|nr:VRR-NUC domain-containing protein [Dichomitus squalens]
MVLGSPSSSLAAKLVFWSGDDSDHAPSGTEARDDGHAEIDAHAHKGQSMYVTIFEDMLMEVLTSEAHLFQRDELDCFMAWHRLSYDAKYLFCRLCLRKTDKWHRLSSLKYEQELGQNGILAAIELLCRGKKGEQREPEDVKPKLEDLNPNIPDLTPPFKVKVEEEDVKPKLEPTEVLLPTEASGPRQSGPEIIDLTMDEDDEPPQAGPSRLSPAIDSPTSSTPSSQDSIRTADYSVFADDEEQADIFELLDCLTTPELETLTQQLKLKPKGAKKRDTLIDAILRGSATQSTLQFTRSKKGKESMLQTKLPFAIKQTQKSLQQSTLPYNRQTQLERVRYIVTNKLKKCIRLNADVVALFRRANLVYFRSTQYTGELLTPALLARAKKREYAAYEFMRTRDIWPAREDLLAYEEALAIEAEVDALLEGTGFGRATPANGGQDRSTSSRTPVPLGGNRFRTPITPGRRAGGAIPESPVVVKSEPDAGEEETERVRNARKVKEILERVYPKWVDLVQTKGERNPRRKGLERFDCGHILTRVVCKGAAALGILREYEEELKVLETLLAQKRWRRARRGRWYERRALVLMTHLKDEEGCLEEALEVVIAGLKDEDTHVVYRPMLERRLTRLEKKLKVPLEECHECEARLQAAIDVHVEGVRIRHRASSLRLDSVGRVRGSENPEQNLGLSWSNRRQPSPRKPREEKPEKGGKTIWKGRDDEEVEVEILALQHYESHGCKGFHCEGRIVTTLFGLLFWEIIFAPIPGAFETRYQAAPLDLAEDTFYYSRQELVEARLKELQLGKAPEILEKTYDANKDVMCVGVRWDLFQKEDLLGIVRCLHTNVLVAICRLMCEDYAARTGGVPDLIIWNEVEGYAKFVEVKGPGDTLQENQKVWIDVLLQAGMPVEVCHVYEQGDEPKGKKGKTPKKVQAEKKAGQKRKRDDWLVESEEEEVDYSQLDRHTEDEAEEAVAGPSKKRRTRAIADSPDSPTPRRMARINSQVEVVITSTPASRHASASPSKSKGSPFKR